MKNKEKNVKILALFWRYVPLVIMAVVGFLAICFHIYPYPALAICFLIYGIYTITIAALSCEHFICGMQNTYREKMTPYSHHPKAWLTKIKREGYFFGGLISSVGLVPLIIYLKYLLKL